VELVEGMEDVGFDVLFLLFCENYMGIVKFDDRYSGDLYSGGSLLK
jgi:hypothetical protein